MKLKKKKNEKTTWILFATHINNKGLGIRICKEISQIKMKNQ